MSFHTNCRLLDFIFYPLSFLWTNVVKIHYQFSISIAFRFLGSCRFFSWCLPVIFVFYIAVVFTFQGVLSIFVLVINFCRLRDFIILIVLFWIIVSLSDHFIRCCRFSLFMSFVCCFYSYMVLDRANEMDSHNFLF